MAWGESEVFGRTPFTVNPQVVSVAAVASYSVVFVTLQGRTAIGSYWNAAVPPVMVTSINPGVGFVVAFASTSWGMQGSATIMWMVKTMPITSVASF